MLRFNPPTPELMTTPTEQQLADWQQKYGRLYLIMAGGHTAYLRAPKRFQLISATIRHQKDAVRLLVYLLHSCWLGGAAEIKVKANDPETPLFQAVIEGMGTHFSTWSDALL